MTLVVANEFTTTIAKAAEVDPEGTAELLRFGLYETLCGLIDYYRPTLDDAAGEVIAKRHQTAMATLAKRYAEKRAAGLDTSEEEEAAEALDTVAKSFGDWFRSPAERQKRAERAERQPRDDGGRFAHVASRQTVDQLNTWASSDEGGQKAKQEMENYANSRDKDKGEAFGRLKAVGGGLRAVSATGSNVDAIGAALVNVAQLGPSAQKVLQPGIQRAAYRYRGTERRPPLPLQNEIHGAFRLKVDASNNRAYRALVAEYRNKSGLSGDQRRLGAASDVATLNLLRELPDLKLTELSANANAYPPSEGIIITDEGDAATQAVGYNGDHFLPFDLKNLRRLSGGAYVRTRAIGGPTTEDIYTGLLTNTRRIQVVSNSGVFTIEFDPDLRGGRRYSDKARQMVDRYGQLLKAVDSGKVYQRDLDQATQRKIRRDAYKAFGPGDSDAKSDYIRREMESAVFDARDVKDEELRDQAERKVLGDRHGEDRKHYSTEEWRDIEEEYHALVREQRETKPQLFKLNGEGYHAAMKALKQQFPYYIRDVNYKPLREWEAGVGVQRPEGDPGPRTYGGDDRGFVVPGGALKPHRLKQSERTYGNKDDSAGATAPRGGTPSGDGEGGAAAEMDDNVKALMPRIALPKGATLDSALSDDDGVVQQQLAEVISKLSPAIVGLRGPELPWDMHTPKMIDQLTGGHFVQGVYNVRGNGDPTQTAQYLLSKEGRKDLPKFAKGLKSVNRLVMSWETSEDTDELNIAADVREEISEEDADDAVERVAQLANVSSPYHKFPAEGDWVLTPPDPTDPRPYPIGDIPGWAFKPKSMEEYLKRTPQVAAAVDELEGHDPQEIHGIITGEITSFKRLKEWGLKLLGGDLQAPVPGGLPDGTERSSAMAAANEPTKTPEYARIRNLWAAWTVIATREGAAELEDLAGGVGGGAEERPKVEAPDRREIGKRHKPRVIVYRADSPVAKAYARLQAESQRSGRLVAL